MSGLRGSADRDALDSPACPTLQARLPDPRRRPRPHRASAARGCARWPRRESGARRRRGLRGRRVRRRRPSRARSSAMTFAIGPPLRDRRRRRALEGRRRRAGRGRARGRPPPETHRRLLRARGGPRQGARRRCARRSRRPAATSSPSSALKARELPRWVARARPASSASSSTARRRAALVAQVGERQQRLLRELEKLALEHGEGARVGVEEVEALGAGSAERKVVDAGRRARRRRRRAAMRAPTSSCARRASGCRACIYRMARRAARRARRGRARSRRGRRPPQIKRSLRMPPFAADRLIARRAAAPTSRRCGGALGALADLELATRGGSASSTDGDRGAAPRCGCAWHDGETRGAGGREGRGAAAVAALRRRRRRGARAARDFLRAPLLRCSAPRLTALSIVDTSSRCSVSAASSSPAVDRRARGGGSTS